MMMSDYTYRLYTGLLLSVVIFTGCYKYKGDEGFVSNNVKYPSKFQTVEVGGALWVSPALNFDGSTMPITCSIERVVAEDGKPVTFLQYPLETRFWGQEFTGQEKTLNEIKAKFYGVTRPALDIDSSNGRIIVYPEADTAKLLAGKYSIDIKVKGPGGEKILKEAMVLTVKKSPGYSFTKVGVDGMDDFKVDFLYKGPGNKLTVRIYNPAGELVDPRLYRGYNYGTAAAPSLRDFATLGPPNPLKYSPFEDRLEMDVLFPLPYPSGVRRIDLEDVNRKVRPGTYTNIWFDFAIFREGSWDMEIRLKW